MYPDQYGTADAERAFRKCHRVRSLQLHVERPRLHETGQAYNHQWCRAHELLRAHPSFGGSFRRGRSCEDLYVTYAKVAQGVPGFAFIFFEATTSVVGTFETCRPAPDPSRNSSLSTRRWRPGGAR